MLRARAGFLQRFSHVLLHTQLSVFTLYILICLEGSLSSHYCPSINGRLLLVTEEFGFWPKSVGVIFQVQP